MVLSVIKGHQKTQLSKTYKNRILWYCWYRTPPSDPWWLITPSIRFRWNLWSTPYYILEWRHRWCQRNFTVEKCRNLILFDFHHNLASSQKWRYKWRHWFLYEIEFIQVLGSNYSNDWYLSHMTAPRTKFLIQIEG